MSTLQLTDASQEITDGYTYDAFGILLNKFGATVNDYLYTGEQYDPNVGFYYLRARYYNASIGRFLTMDDFPELMFEPLSLHRYLYSMNDPLNYWDFDGNSSLQSYIIEIQISLLIISAITLATTSLANTLAGLGTQTEWHGNVFWLSLLGWTIYYLYLEGIYDGPDDGIFSGLPNKSWGRYLVITKNIVGISWIPYGFAGGFSDQVYIKSPGLWQAWPPILGGPVFRAGASLTALVGVRGAAMAMGAGAIISIAGPLTDTVGINVGVSVGFSIPFDW